MGGAAVYRRCRIRRCGGVPSQLSPRKRPYLIEVMLTTAVWAPGTGPEVPEVRVGKLGRPRTAYRDGEHAPVSVAELTLCQTRAALSKVTWQHRAGPQRRGHFGALRL